MLIDLPSHNTDNKPARLKKKNKLHISIFKVGKKKKIDQWPSNFFSPQIGPSKT